MRSDTQMIDDSLAIVGIEKKSKLYPQARRDLSEAVYDFEVQVQRPATPKEKQEIMDNQLMKVTGNGGFFGTNEKYRFEVDDDQSYRVRDVSQIPKKDLLAVNAQLAKAGITNPTNEDRIKAYNRSWSASKTPANPDIATYLLHNMNPMGSK